MRTRLKSLIALGTLCLGLGLSSCQCSNKPDIGPVEDDEEESTAARPAAPAARALLLA